MPNGGKCRGRVRKKGICASRTKLACYFSPYFTSFFLVLAHLVIILVVSSNAMRDILSRKKIVIPGNGYTRLYQERNFV